MRSTLEQEAYIEGFKQGIKLAIESIQGSADLFTIRSIQGSANLFIKLVNDDMRGEA